MIYEQIVQGTEEWFEIKLGVPSAGTFNTLLTTQGKRSAQVKSTIKKLADELIRYEHFESYTNEDMEDGRLREAEGRTRYAEGLDMTTIYHPDLDHTKGVVKEVGFVTKEFEQLAHIAPFNKIGCSPDGLVFKNNKLVGGVEIKSPRPYTHLGYLEDKKIPSNYLLQVVGNMYVCGCEYWDFFSHHKDYEKSFCLRAHRDETSIQELFSELEQVCIDTLLGIHNLFNHYSNSDKETIIERKQLIYKQKGE